MTGGKIINDPVSGFIEVPYGPLLDILLHPCFQRLSRIKQLGLSSTVYPGAQHTRLQHSLGAYHLMGGAVKHLQEKGNPISDSEAEAVKIAILLHDIGHGPFSHVLEHTLVSGISHEEISEMIMERMNREMQGRLSLGIEIFKGNHPKRFLHQLVSGQLDMDRLDYLRRDAFYTGVMEGNIGSDRIIQMLNVSDDNLVVEQKGIYSIENFLLTRRLMYWQVYLHKTSVGYERMLVNALRRAHWLASQGHRLFASPSLLFFLQNTITRKEFKENPDCIRHFLRLDDNDVWTALKVWCDDPDPILSLLSQGITDRHLFKVEVLEEPLSCERQQQLEASLAGKLHIATDDTQYFWYLADIRNQMYAPDDGQIGILSKNGAVKDITQVSDVMNPSLVTRPDKKYYLCYYK